MDVWRDHALCGDPGAAQAIAALEAPAYAIVGEHPLGGRSVIRVLPDFRWGPACIEKIEHFGFVLPVIKL
jgi:hypothetical protein